MKNEKLLKAVKREALSEKSKALTIVTLEHRAGEIESQKDRVDGVCVGPEFKLTESDQTPLFNRQNERTKKAELNISVLRCGRYRKGIQIGQSSLSLRCGLQESLVQIKLSQFFSPAIRTASLSIPAFDLISE